MLPGGGRRTGGGDVSSVVWRARTMPSEGSSSISSGSALGRMNGRVSASSEIGGGVEVGGIDPGAVAPADFASTLAGIGGGTDAGRARGGSGAGARDSGARDSPRDSPRD